MLNSRKIEYMPNPGFRQSWIFLLKLFYNTLKNKNIGAFYLAKKKTVSFETASIQLKIKTQFTNLLFNLSILLVDK
jgi:hypothetical protein